MLKKGKMIVEEKLAEASEVGKEKLAEATQKATEVGMDTKEWVAGKVSEMPSIQQTASIAKERMERAADQVSIPLPIHSPVFPPFLQMLIFLFFSSL